MALEINYELYLWEWHWESIGNCTCANDFGNQLGTVLVQRLEIAVNHVGANK